MGKGRGRGKGEEGESFCHSDLLYSGVALIPPGPDQTTERGQEEADLWQKSKSKERKTSTDSR